MIKTPHVFRHAFLTGFCAAGLVMGGCSATMLDPSAFGIFQDQDVNLTAKSYAAADYLDQQAKTFLGSYGLLRAQPLLDVDESRTSSRIGDMIPQQVGVRFSQLGYRVDVTDVSGEGEATNYLKPNTGQGERADYILSGTYRRRPTELDVNLRITDARSQRVVASFDYSLPMTHDIAELSEPQARIFRVEQ